MHREVKGKYMKKILLTLCLFIAILTSVAMANPCKYIVWGHIFNKDGLPCPGVEVNIDRAQLGLPVLISITDSQGYYVFFSDGSEFDGNLTLIVNREIMTNFIRVSEIETAYGLDYRYNTKSFGNIYKCPIVYITDTGNCYHRYNCQYVAKSCHPIPELYCRMKSVRPCSVCRPDLIKVEREEVKKKKK